MIYQCLSHYLPSGYLTVRHGKSPCFIGKPSISMGRLYHGYVSHSQRVFRVSTIRGGAGFRNHPPDHRIMRLLCSVPMRSGRLFGLHADFDSRGPRSRTVQIRHFLSTERVMRREVLISD